MDTLKKANQLSQEISELKHFLTTVDPVKNMRRGSGKYDINTILKKKSDVSYSIFGTRWFGCGTHEQEISVPNTLIKQLNHLASELLTEKEAILNSLLTPQPNEK